MHLFLAASCRGTKILMQNHIDFLFETKSIVLLTIFLNDMQGLCITKLPTCNYKRIQEPTQCCVYRFAFSFFNLHSQFIHLLYLPCKNKGKRFVLKQKQLSSNRSLNIYHKMIQEYGRTNYSSTVAKSLTTGVIV